MNRRQLVKKSLQAEPSDLFKLLKENIDLCDLRTARILCAKCYEAWATQPQNVTKIVEVLAGISAVNDDIEIRANFFWASAIGSLVAGNPFECLESLDQSERRFKQSSNLHAAATTQISKLYALGLLGRYDEAVECGRRARAVFLAEKDDYSAGKIEHNIGNLYLRRDLYAQAEPFLRSAQRRFARLGDQGQTAMVENNLGLAKASQNQFDEAEKIYIRALKRAKKHGLIPIQADLEASISNFHLFRGRYDEALAFLERARSKYESLRLPHQSATIELEIADVYLELNLISEAIVCYRRTEERFRELGLKAELARCIRNHARALLAIGETDAAKSYLDRAEQMFLAEGNLIAAAAAVLVKARVAFDAGDNETARRFAESALRSFEEGGNRRKELLARWLIGEITAAEGDRAAAIRAFRQTLATTENESRQVEFLCLVSIGRLSGDEQLLRRAVEIAETSRAGLVAEEIRTNFLADKLTAFTELVKLRLSAGDVADAFVWHERSRARTLLETIETDNAALPADPVLTTLRDDLNWAYSRLTRATRDGGNIGPDVAALQQNVEKLEAEFSEKLMRLSVSDHRLKINNDEISLPALREKLAETTLVEYVSIDGNVGAFVVNSDGIRFFGGLCEKKTLENEIRQFLFQIKTGRFAYELSPENRSLALRRMISHSRTLFELLLRPFVKSLKSRLVFVPAGALNYLPFHALHDGESYVAEAFEVSYAPSAAVLLHCLGQKLPATRRGLLVGVADSGNPLVRAETESLAACFDSFATLFGNKATVRNLARSVSGFDAIHLACHGNFRPDNPRFSSITLAGGNLTVSDARNLDLREKFVALSACETGLNKVESGEEIVGLTRGFLSAGASSIMMSLWKVDDRATFALMNSFYRRADALQNPAGALRNAQLEVLSTDPHPYFWAPFVVIGHW